MYIHIGNDFVLHKNDILGIFDFDLLYMSETTKKYLKKLEADNRLISITDDVPKSVVIAFSGTDEVAYLSGLNSKTILNRKKIN